jgi:hypothetical protein
VGWQWNEAAFGQFRQQIWSRHFIGQFSHQGWFVKLNHLKNI